jgi:hypothetical protein
MTTSPMVGVFREGVAVKYAWIQEHQDSYPVQTMYCLLGVSRSGFYKWLDATPSPRAIRSETIEATVCRVFEASRGIYGSKKIAHELQKSTEVEQACVTRLRKRSRPGVPQQARCFITATEVANTPVSHSRTY